MDINKESIKFHKKLKGKIALKPKARIKSRKDLSLMYTPGVAAVSSAIAKDVKKSWELTSRGNWVAVVSDGSAVLGLGNIGPEGAMPVMEGKAVLFKEFADVDAFPICLDIQDPDEIISIVKALAPSFGGINLEDISAPNCFYIEEKLKKELDIPVFHDDQHGTAVVVLAGLINALKLTGRSFKSLKVLVNGVGAAGVAITKILLSQGVKDIVLVDSRGTIYKGRKNLNATKKELAKVTNPAKVCCGLAEGLRDRDVFIGVSQGKILSGKMVKSMAKDPIIFALANPIPEIMPDIAKKAGAKIVATGRSDFANQVNNVLAFPGIFRGAFDAGASDITEKMKLAAAKALASYVKKPAVDKIIPNPLDKKVAEKVAKAVARAAKH